MCVAGGVIAIEGLDGVGKTTVARAAASRLDALCVNFPSAGFLEPHTPTLARLDSNARLLLFAAGVLEVVDDVRSYDMLIADRFMGSVVGMHPECDEGLLRALTELPHRDPSVVVFLEASEPVRQHRLGSRLARDPFELALDADARFRNVVRDRTLDYYSARGVAVERVETSALTVDETTNMVTDLAREDGRR
jgi:thymidylate kinase